MTKQDIREQIADNFRYHRGGVCQDILPHDYERADHILAITDAHFAEQVRGLDETPPDDFTRLAQVTYRAGIIHTKAAVLALIEEA